MKLEVINSKNYYNASKQAVVRNNVSNAVEKNKTMTAPTQTDSHYSDTVPSAASTNNTNSAEALKAQKLATAPISYSFVRDIKLPFSSNAKLYRLANGQKVAILEKKGPTVLETYYNVGSMNEHDKQRGISHFNEHMAFNGSKDSLGNGLGAGEFFQTVNKIGAITNASTGFSQTNYFISSQLLGSDSVFDASAYLQSQQLQYPEHTAEMVEKEKAPVTSEISMVGDQPENVAMNQCIKNLYGIETTSPDLIAGTISNINNLTREDTLNYHNTWYTPDNSVTVVTGEVPQQEAIDTIAKYFNKSAFTPVQNRKYQEFDEIQKPVRVDLKMPKAQSTTTVLGFKGPQNNSTSENIIMEVLVTALLGYKNAKITKELNKIQSSAMMNIERVGNRPTDPRTILIASQSTPQKSEDVLNIIYQEIAKISQQPLSFDELQAAKKILKMTYSKISENSQALNSLLGNAIMDDDLAYVENYLPILDSITPQDVSAFARKYLDLNKVSISVVHPQKMNDNEIMMNYNNTQNKVSAFVSTPSISFKGRIEDKMFDLNKVRQYRLANNMEVVFNQNQSDIATSKITLKTVTPANVKPGVPAILSVMLNEGSLNKNYDQFYENVHKAGMSLKFDATYNSINAEVESLSTDVPYSIDLIKEVLTQPRFNESSLSYAKKMVEELVLNMENSAEEPAVRELLPGLNEFATKEEILKSLNTITMQDIMDFYNHIKNNAMAKAVVTAPMSKNPQLEQAVMNKLSVGLRNFQPYTNERFKAYIPITENKIITKVEQRNQADIFQGFKFKTNYNPKDHMTFILMNTILGGGPSSRLFNDLRETQKLAYRVESNLDFVGDTGIISLAIKTTTDNPSENVQQFDNVKKSLSGFKKHIEKLKNELVTQEELDAAKLRIKTKLLNSIESSSAQTTVLSNAKDTVYGLASINENIKLVDTITAQDIQNAANYMFAGKSLTSILASQKTIENMDTNV